jgi:hypothetical protein
MSQQKDDLTRQAEEELRLRRSLGGSRTKEQDVQSVGTSLQRSLLPPSTGFGTFPRREQSRDRFLQTRSSGGTGGTNPFLALLSRLGSSYEDPVGSAGFDLGKKLAGWKPTVSPRPSPYLPAALPQPVIATAGAEDEAGAAGAEDEGGIDPADLPQGASDESRFLLQSFTRGNPDEMTPTGFTLRELANFTVKAIKGNLSSAQIGEFRNIQAFLLAQDLAGDEGTVWGTRLQSIIEEYTKKKAADATLANNKLAFDQLETDTGYSSELLERIGDVEVGRILALQAELKQRESVGLARRDALQMSYPGFLGVPTLGADETGDGLGGFPNLPGGFGFDATTLGDLTPETFQQLMTTAETRRETSQSKGRNIELSEVMSKNLAPLFEEFGLTLSPEMLQFGPDFIISLLNMLIAQKALKERTTGGGSFRAPSGFFRPFRQTAEA